MRQTIRSAAVLLLFLGVLWTPAASAQGVQGGVKIGLNSANLSFEESGEFENLENRTGMLAGGFLVWPVTRTFAIQAEGLFSQKGASVSEQGMSGELQLDYVDIPILARFSASPSARTMLHVYAGPSLNFNVRARTKATFAGETSEEDFSDDVRSLETGLVLGAGVQVSRLLFEGRYSWGLTNIDKEDAGSDPTVKNRTLSVTAGIRF
jgi:hypothetical protein